VNNLSSQVNDNIAQTTVVLPQVVSVKTQADTNIVISAPEQAKASIMAAPEAVQTAPKVIFDKFGASKQETPSKSLVSDVRWVSDTIVKPAAISNEAAAVFVSGKQTIFDRVAEFADSIKEQIVLKQVVSNINDQSGQKINEIKMVLKPENLGSVYIKLEHTNGEIKGTIQVTNDSVKDTLKASLPELKAALGNIGITVNNFDISMATTSTGSDFQGGQGRNNFSQWQAAAQQVAGVDAFVNADGYLNYLA
jgi:flagellar hook-length control protein FliK